MELLSYDVNTEMYSAKVKGDKYQSNVIFKIARENAQLLKSNQASITATGYFDYSAAQLENLLAILFKTPGEVIPVMVQTDPVMLKDEIDKYCTYQFAFSPDGLHIALSYFREGQYYNNKVGSWIRVWKTSTGKASSERYLLENI